MRRLWHGRFWNRRWHASTGSIRRRRRKGLMSSKSFQYVRPDTVDEVVALLGAHGPAARLLAGGTDLLVRFRLGHVRPAIVIDLKRADGLSAAITEINSTLRVGARVVMADLIADGRIRRHFPALVEAARVVGSMQIRQRATLAGNICNASPAADTAPASVARSEEHTSELQSQSNLVCRLLLEKKKKTKHEDYPRPLWRHTA